MSFLFFKGVCQGVFKARNFIPESYLISLNIKTIFYLFKTKITF